MKYYMCDESEYAFLLADFKIMFIEEEEKQMVLYELKREYGGNMWCRRGERFIERGDCGRVCEDYQPCNGKNGRCRNLENGFMKTGKVFVLTESGLKEVEPICGFCTEYDSDNYYCPHEGEKMEEDTCDGFRGEGEENGTKTISPK